MKAVTRARRFCSDSAGNVAITFALCLFALVLAVGAGVDYSRGNSARSNLQAALDAAALAAGAVGTRNTDERIKNGEQYFAANFTLPNPPTPTITIEGNVVTATARYQVPTTLMAIARIENVTVGGIASTVFQTEPDCVLLLEKTEMALVANSPSKLQAPCGVQVNSSNKEAILVNSGGEVKASAVCVNGKYRENGGTISPKPRTGCPAAADPLANLPEPAQAKGPCDYTDVVVNNFAITTLDPGVYCKRLEINAGANVTLRPGIYVFQDAELVVNSLAKLSGSEVMLFFSGTKGFLNVNSLSSLEIKAPRTGPYKGIVIYQSRDPDTLTTNPFIINSNSSTTLEGTVYMPNGALTLNSIGKANSGASYTIVIARRMELNSGGTFEINTNYKGATPLAAGLEQMSLGKSVNVRLVK
jgi:Putative Flp pilus-assembly TadE/G-like